MLCKSNKKINTAFYNLYFVFLVTLARTAILNPSKCFRSKGTMFGLYFSPFLKAARHCLPELPTLICLSLLTLVSVSCLRVGVLKFSGIYNTAGANHCSCNILFPLVLTFVRWMCLHTYSFWLLFALSGCRLYLTTLQFYSLLFCRM